jgi:hypothetical protein
MGNIRGPFDRYIAQTEARMDEETKRKEENTQAGTPHVPLQQVIDMLHELRNKTMNDISLIRQDMDELERSILETIGRRAVDQQYLFE